MKYNIDSGYEVVVGPLQVDYPEEYDLYGCVYDDFDDQRKVINILSVPVPRIGNLTEDSYESIPFLEDILSDQEYLDEYYKPHRNFNNGLYYWWPTIEDVNL